MARRKEKEDLGVKEPKSESSKYKLVNKTQSILAVPAINANGELTYLHLRIQGKGAEPPPVVEDWNITPEMKALEKRGLISLVKTN